MVVTATVPASRDEAARLLLDALVSACPGSEACLIGSMATPGEADAFSDIDVRWTLPPSPAARPPALRRTLEQVGEVESLRLDPDDRLGFALVFVRFRRWPLWWRVDLEIHSGDARSRDVPDADPWLPGESACMGVVVTLKALARRRPEAAVEDVFAAALRRVDAPNVAGSWQRRIASLLDHVGATSPPTADLVVRTRQLAREVLGG